MPTSIHHTPSQIQIIDSTIQSDYSDYLALTGKLSHCSLEKRLQIAISLLIGRDYQFDPQGDGRCSDLDHRTSITFCNFDCVTFCDAVLAMINSHSLESMHEKHRHIRYLDGTKMYFYRHHFIEGTWLEHNRMHGILSGPAMGDTTDLPVALRTATLNYPQWLIYQKSYLKQRFSRSIDLTKCLVPDIYRNISEVSIPYTPIGAIVHEDGTINSDIFSRIPSPCILMTISTKTHSRNSTIPSDIENIGTDLAVTHLGFVTKVGQTLYFNHAKHNYQTVSVTLASYLCFIQKHLPQVAGIALEHINDCSS